MSHPIYQGQDNLKKVLRTALVGIRPADQVLLKGYLRILLRLEADLEWVAANHPQVDLFFISNDFRDAASVVKLLSEQAQKPVLYVSRSDDDEGHMADNQIVLPLKTMTALNNWLMTSIPVLKKAGTATSILQQHDKTENTTQTTPPPPVDARPEPPQVKNAIVSPPEPTVTTEAVAAPVTKPVVQSYQSVIELIQKLQQRPEGLYEISSYHDDQEQTLAIVEPSRARVWLSKAADAATLPLTLKWQLKTAQAERPADTDAHDMLQWLWQYGWQHAGVLLPLIHDDATYQLRYWVKPALAAGERRTGGRVVTNKDRQELLRVMTAIEHAPRNVTQLAHRADISVGAAKKIVASLLFSGSLQTDNYQNLDHRISRTVNNTVTPEAPAVDVPPVAAMEAAETNDANPPPSAPKQMTLDEVLAKRARGETSAQPTSSSIELASRAPDTATDSSQAPAPSQQNKKGFLSRLRDKLGIA